MRRPGSGAEAWGASTLAGEEGGGAEAGKQGVLEPKSEGTGSLERTRGPSAAESGERDGDEPIDLV